MNTFYIMLFVIIGLVFGSFYNVVGIRLCKGESIVFPGSHCMNCNHKLAFYELIPVFSYVFLRGRCKYCKKKISIMYPLVELFTGILFGVSFYKYGFTIELVLSILLCSLFMIIVVTDLSYYIIPDSILLFFGMFIFIYNIISKGFLGACTYVVYGLIMFLLMYLLMVLGNAIFKKESLGGGDIKLMGILGMINKPLISVLGLSIASFVALPCSLLFLFRNKDKIIPFGPFIVFGFIIVMYLGIDTKSLISFLVNN